MYSGAQATPGCGLSVARGEAEDNMWFKGSAGCMGVSGMVVASKGLQCCSSSERHGAHARGFVQRHVAGQAHLGFVASCKML
jgi:hypothetical protein